MTIEIDLPEDVVRQLEASWGADGLSRKALEALASEAYRSGAITSAEVQRVLGLASRWEAESFLKRAHAHLDYDASDVEQDASAIRQVSPR